MWLNFGSLIMSKYSLIPNIYRIFGISGKISHHCFSYEVKVYSVKSPKQVSGTIDSTSKGTSLLVTNEACKRHSDFKVSLRYQGINVRENVIMYFIKCVFYTKVH